MTPDELKRATSHFNGLAVEASKRAMTAQLEILSAQSAQELAEAITKFHTALTEAQATWGRVAQKLGTEPTSH